MKKSLLRNTMSLIGVSLIFACATFIFNIWLFSSYSEISVADASFLEGIIFVILGVVFCLGSGGINPDTRKAVALAALADALGKEAPGPSEIYKSEAWKPKGFMRLGLIFIITGIILILIYLVLFYGVPWKLEQV